MLTDKFEAATLSLGVFFDNLHKVVERAAFPTDSLGFLCCVWLEGNQVVNMMATNANAIL